MSLKRKTTSHEDHQADVLREYQRAVRVDAHAARILTESQHVARVAKRTLTDARAALQRVSEAV